MEPFVGEIRIFAGTFAPKDWVMCQGQTLSITAYPALYALLGNFYGGDGKTTFAVPNLQARVPVGRSNTPPPGMTNTYVLGAAGGQFMVTLAPANLPAHTHTLYASTDTATTITPGPTVGFATATHGFTYYSTTTTMVNLAPSAISTDGYPSPNPHTNLMPSRGMVYIIATGGIFPEFP